MMLNTCMYEQNKYNREKEKNKKGKGIWSQVKKITIYNFTKSAKLNHPDLLCR